MTLWCPLNLAIEPSTTMYRQAMDGQTTGGLHRQAMDRWYRQITDGQYRQVTYMYVLLLIAFHSCPLNYTVHSDCDDRGSSVLNNFGVELGIAVVRCLFFKHTDRLFSVNARHT